jgi:hypothetical protein
MPQARNLVEERLGGRGLGIRLPFSIRARARREGTETREAD